MCIRDSAGLVRADELRLVAVAVVGVHHERGRTLDDMMVREDIDVYKRQALWSCTAPTLCPTPRRRSPTSFRTAPSLSLIHICPAVIFGSDGLDGCAHAAFEILSNAVDEARQG